MCTFKAPVDSKFWMVSVELQGAAWASAFSEGLQLKFLLLSTERSRWLQDLQQDVQQQCCASVPLVCSASLLAIFFDWLSCYSDVSSSGVHWQHELIEPVRLRLRAHCMLSCLRVLDRCKLSGLINISHGSSRLMLWRLRRCTEPLPTLPAKTGCVRCHAQTVPRVLLSTHKHACTSGQDGPHHEAK